jgi:alpha-galactosidase
MNRYISEAGWPGAQPIKQKELRIRYAQNLLDIIRTLRQKHPDVVFETCSGGGGRTNLGMLQVTDQIWTSDNTDAGDRILIQNGYSHFFPAKTMVNWVTDHEWHNKKTPLEFRFHVAMAGNLGIGNDLHKWTEKDKAVARTNIELYKSVRHIIQFGDQYRLLNPFENNQSAVQFVTRNGEESVIFAYQTLEIVPMAAYRAASIIRLVLHGLQADAMYSVKDGENVQEVQGRALMSSGISVMLQGNFTSRVVIVKKI